MIHHAGKVLEVIAVLGTFSGIAYYMLCLWSAAKFLRERKAQSKATGEDASSPQETPPVSILKPLKGSDPDIYASLRSHCVQDYPEYEIIFGVTDRCDPAVEIIERLIREFPQLTIQLVICEKDLGTNTKVSNLAQMLPVARYDHLIVNDGDIRVEPEYLRRVIAPLNDSKVGMVTCLYRGVPAPTLGSRLESIGISTDFSGGVLVARQIEGGVRFGMGSTLAFRRRDLEAIGGFESFVDYLADDYEIGSRMAARGLEVRLCEAAVETLLPAYTLREFAQHQLRWARTIRDCRSSRYGGMLFTFGLPWAFLTLVLAHEVRWAWELLCVALTIRLAVALVVGTAVLQDRQVIPYLWLIPLRDVVALFVWMASFAGHKVSWRGDYFYLKNGKLARISPENSAPHL